MPALIFPWGKAGLAKLSGKAPATTPAGQITPPATGAKGMLSAPVHPTVAPATTAPSAQQATAPTAGYRSPVTVQSSILEQQSLRTATDQWTGTTAISGIRQPWQLPSTNITNLTLGVSVAYSSGASVTGSIAPTSAIAYILINDENGRTVMTIPGNLLHETYKRFSPWTDDFTETASTVLASQSGTALATVPVQLPYLRLPALPDGAQYQVAVVYQPISALGSYATNNGPTVTAATGVTGYTVTVSITPTFGDADAVGGLQSYLVPFSCQVSKGVNDLAQNMALKNVSVVDLLMYGFAADADLDHIQLTTNSGAQIPYEDEPNLLAAYFSKIQAARATGVFWLLPNSQIGFNASTSFQIFLTSGATTTVIYFLGYRVAPPGS
jgi:hypothetical protein